MSECGREMRDGACRMDAGHRGRCSTVVHGCDACGKTRRGRTPYVTLNDANGDPEVGFCWFCAKVDR